MQEPMDNITDEKPSANKWPIIAAFVLGVMMLAGSVGGALYVRQMRERQALQAQLEEMLNGASNVSRWMRQFDDQLAAYGLEEEEQSRLEELSDKAKKLDEENVERRVAFEVSVSKLELTEDTEEQQG